MEHDASAGHAPSHAARLASGAAEVPVPAGTIYTCPMHPEIRQDRRGNCPKCGMTLEPLMPSSSAAPTCGR